MRLTAAGQWLVILSVLGGCLFLGGSAVTASDATASPTVAENTTLVGAMNAYSEGRAQLLNGTGDVAWEYSAGVVAVGDVSMPPSGNYLLSYTRRLNQTDIPLDEHPDKYPDRENRGDEVLTGAVIVDPATKQTVWRYEFRVPYLLNHEVHDAEVLPNGNIVIADMGRERIFIVDRQTKRIEWTWNASAFYEPPDRPRYSDWLHINDVDHIGDGRFLVSVRNANQLVVVERGAGVVEVINRDHHDSNDGNCRGPQGLQMAVENPRCGDPAILNHQHNPQWLGDGHILVADSENDRIVELVRDGGNWTIGWTDHGANGVRYDWPRDADRLPNGNTLITDTRNSRVVEVDESGAVVWAATAPPNVYEADRGPEYPAGEPYGSSGDSAPYQQPFEVVGLAHGAVQHAVPLPRWLGEWEALATLLMFLWSWLGMICWALGVVRERASNRAETDGWLEIAD